MKYGFYMSFSNNFDKGLIKNILIKNVEQEKKSQLKKGFRLMAPYQINIGYNADDFVYNRQTAIVKCQRFKIPRIIKNHLINLR